MFRVLEEEKWISVAMLVTLVFSIASRIIIWILYQNMIKETDNMSATDNKILKQCKLKFANCYQLNNGVANVPVFVDKFLNRLAIGPLNVQTLYHLSGQLMLLSVFFAGVGVCKSIIAGRSLGELLPFYIVSFMGLYLYFSVSAVTDIKGKRRVLKINLVDYLENHMVNKLSSVEADMEIVAPGSRGRAAAGQLGERLFAGYGTENGNAGLHSENAETAQTKRFSKSEEKELEELLKEFLKNA